ncbi:MAG: Ribonuclease P protein component [Moorella sp. 60_41]|nr:MAG: Ribonuclease P protein component [Moorella sp. 60_41]
MLPAARRIRCPGEFRQVYRRGNRLSSRALVLYWRPNRLGITRFGFSVSKKMGRAVDRNRSKRLLREACHRHLDRFRAGFDVVLVARPGLKELSYSRVVEEVLSLGKRAKLVCDGGDG